MKSPIFIYITMHAHRYICLFLCMQKDKNSEVSRHVLFQVSGSGAIVSPIMVVNSLPSWPPAAPASLSYPVAFPLIRRPADINRILVS